MRKHQLNARLQSSVWRIPESGGGSCSGSCSGSPAGGFLPSQPESDVGAARPAWVLVHRACPHLCLKVDPLLPRLTPRTFTSEHKERHDGVFDRWKERGRKKRNGMDCQTA